MNLNILYKNELLETYFAAPSEIFLNNVFGIWIGLIGLILFIISLLLKKNRYLIFLASNLLILIGQYVYFSDFIDESYVSPRMSYNFSNHGFLSFFEYSLSQASVEILQTIISGLSLKNVDDIIFSYYTVHLIIYIASFIIFIELIKKYFLNKNSLDFLILSLIIQLPLNFIISASSGLGMNLLTLAIIMSFYFFHLKKLRVSLIFTTFFPLIRPDGILYSMIFLIYYSLNKKLIHYRYFILSIMSFILYGILSFHFYKEWPAPPMAFKNHDISLLFNLSFYDGKILNLFSFFKDHFAYGFIILLFLYYQFNKYKFDIINYFNDDIKSLSLIVLNILFFGILILYLLLSVGIHGDFRYSMIFSLFLSVSSALLYCQINFKNFSMPLLILIILILQIFLNKAEYLYPLSNDYKAKQTIVDSYSKAAQELKKINLNNHIIASVEMSSFPLYMETDVIDLYGYSNSLITSSSTCNSSFIKINSEYIKEVNPDIIFHQALDKEYFNILNGPDNKYELKNYISHNLDKWLLKDYFSKAENYYGDMNFIVENYDFFFLENNEIYSVYLIKKNKVKYFINEFALTGYTLIKTYFFDEIKFKENYNNTKDLNIKC